MCWKAPQGQRPEPLLLPGLVSLVQKRDGDLVELQPSGQARSRLQPAFGQNHNPLSLVSPSAPNAHVTHQFGGFVPCGN